MHREKKRPPPNLIRSADIFRLLGFGWYFATSLAIGLVGGYFLDRWLDTKPWFLLAGLLLGTVAGFYGMFKMLLPVYKREAGKSAKRGDVE